MARHTFHNSFFAALCALSLIAAGCVIHTSGCNISVNQARFERTTQQQAPLGSNTAIDVESPNGAITITGAETAEFNVEARITGYAPTEEEAQELAEKTEIRLEPAGDTLRVRADTPDTGNNRGVSVSYTITAPKRISVRCDSSFGSLHVAGIGGSVDAKSGNGSIDVQDIQGPVNVHSSFGAITCRNVTGQMSEIESGNGAITISELKGSAKIQTSFGSISCRDLSDGDYHVKSGNGRIEIIHASAGECDASSSFGAITCTDVKGDPVKLHSDNGSVDASEVEAPNLSLSSAFGAIRAERITTADIDAHSSNGGIHIVCSESCPADLKAEVKSGFGGIDFTAPPQFAGQIRLSTGFGSVRTDQSVTVKGEIDKKNITGTIGEGNGSIHLESSNGSVELK